MVGWERREKVQFQKSSLCRCGRESGLIYIVAITRITRLSRAQAELVIAVWTATRKFHFIGCRARAEKSRGLQHTDKYNGAIGKHMVE